MKITRILILIITLSACNNESKYRKAADDIAKNVPEPTNMNVGKEKYTLDIPAGWTTKNQTAYGIEYYFLLAPKTKDDPNTNINVVSEDMQNLSLDEYTEKAIQSIKKSIPSAMILQHGDIIANDLKGIWYSYTMQPQGIDVTLVGYIFPKNGVAYIISAGTQTKDAARYRSTFDLVAKSLKFEK